MIRLAFLRYWIERLPNDQVRFRFPQLPEVDFEAPSIAVGRAAMEEKVLAALEVRAKEGTLPKEEPRRAGESALCLTPTHAAKILLITTMKDKKLYPSELARRLDIKPQEAQRIVKLTHPTKINTLAEAFHVMGLKLVLSAEPAGR